MTSRIALFALAALAIVGCAPLAVGGEWRLSRPVSANGWTVQEASARFAGDGTVEIIAGAYSPSTCSTLGTVTVHAGWFVNAAGQTVLRNATCTASSETCNSNVIVYCNASFALTQVVYNERAGNLESPDRRVIWSR
jgi:hypothetical protein